MRKRELIILILFGVIFSKIFSQWQLNSNKDAYILLKKGITTPKSASSHNPILIDGNIALNEFCSGNGTTGESWETAHVIENYEIDANGLNSGLEIRNTNLYLIIRNINITNSGTEFYDSGFSLHFVSYIKIINSNSFNNTNGFTLYNAQYNNLIGNKAWNNTNNGFYLEGSSNNNSLSGNRAWNSVFNGFILSASHNNTLLGNFAFDNARGFYLFYSNNNILLGNMGTKIGTSFDLSFSRNNLVSNNTGIDFIIRSSHYNSYIGNNAFNSHLYGFRLYKSNYNLLSGNNASNNIYGFNLYRSNNNSLLGNTISYNEFYGLFIHSSSGDNKIFDNIFKKNAMIDIQDLGTDNLIDNNLFTEVLFASFKANSYLIFLDELVELHDTTTGGCGDLSYSWDFGDSSEVSTVASPVHQFTSPEIFTVTLTVTDSENDVSVFSINISVEMDTSPSALFIFDSNRIKNTANVQFTDVTSGGNKPYTYQWSFGDLSPNSTSANPVHQYSLDENYTVTLTVTDRDGDISVYSFELKLPPDQSLSFFWYYITIGSVISAIVMVTSAVFIKKRKIS